MFPTLLRIDGFELAAYGAFVAGGFLGGIAYLSSCRKSLGLDESVLNRFLTGIFLSGMGGAKLLYLLVYWREREWTLAGMVSDLRFGFIYFGGFLGALAFGAWFTRREKLSFWKLADATAPALAIGQAVGRLGCLAAGCCYGAPTDLFWGLAFHRADALVPASLLGVPLHPTQLYESLGAAAIALLLHFGVLPGIRAGRFREGASFMGYLVLYPVLRFTVEVFRADDRGFYALDLSISQWVSVGVLAAAAVLFARRRREA